MSGQNTLPCALVFETNEEGVTINGTTVQCEKWSIPDHHTKALYF